MSEPHASSNKANFATLAVNHIIAEVITACVFNNQIIDSLYVSVIGHCNNVNVMFVNKVSDLAKNLNTTTIKKNVSDGAGSLVKVNEIVRIFVNDTASGGTPITEAFQHTYKGVERFSSNNLDSFSPIVINITDGQPTDNIHIAVDEAKRITNLKTADGHLILMNVCFATKLEGTALFPSRMNFSTTNKIASFLFNIPPVLPDFLTNRAKEVGFNIEFGSRGFILNNDYPESLINIFNFYLDYGELRRKYAS